MEKHQCKLCSRSFNNGRALGGHMKSHMAVLPLPPKSHHHQQQQQLAAAAAAESTHSASSSFSTSEDDEQQKKGLQEEEEYHKGLVYGLRENPKRSFRLADPEFAFQADAAGSNVIQDRESETESRNPTLRRSKRNRRTTFTENSKLGLLKKQLKLTTSTFVDSSPEQPLSSVLDTSPEENVAMYLIMLSRDVWMRTNEEAVDQQQNSKEVVVFADGVGEFEKLEEIKLIKVRGKNRCDKCNTLFRSYQAMCVHRKVCFQSEDEANNAAAGSASLFKCPFCSKLFGSGQALGGHKRSHLSGSSGYTKTAVTRVFKAVKETFIDLNVPAPEEEDDFSVVSDAQEVTEPRPTDGVLPSS